MGRHVIKALIQVAVVAALWHDAIQAVLHKAHASLVRLPCPTDAKGLPCH